MVQSERRSEKFLPADVVTQNSSRIWPTFKRNCHRKSSKVGEAAEFQDVVFSLPGGTGNRPHRRKRPPTGQDGARAYAVQPWRSHRRDGGRIAALR